MTIRKSIIGLLITSAFFGGIFLYYSRDSKAEKLSTKVSPSAASAQVTSSPVTLDATAEDQGLSVQEVETKAFVFCAFPTHGHFASLSTAKRNLVYKALIINRPALYNHLMVNAKITSAGPLETIVSMSLEPVIAENLRTQFYADLAKSLGVDLTLMMEDESFTKGIDVYMDHWGKYPFTMDVVLPAERKDESTVHIYLVNSHEARSSTNTHIPLLIFQRLYGPLANRLMFP